MQRQTVNESLSAIKTQDKT